jgi:RNA polymerase sigma factor for flagellar operon FliA
MSGMAVYAEKTGERFAQTDNEQIVLYTPLVKRIAYHLMSRLPPNVQQDDLIQAGLIGLLEALRNYDASQGASFQTYARIRIRGAMLD